MHGGLVKVCQEQLWDCGLACVLSILLASRGKRRLTRSSVERFAASVPPRSLWTVELVLLLYENGVDNVVFSTTSIGINAELKGRLEFYSSGIGMIDDKQEIEIASAFERVKELGITMKNIQVEDDELEQALKNSVVVIALVDKSVLEGVEGPFLGHYIVLEGYDDRNNVFFAKDPDVQSQETDIIPGPVLHDARKRFGTDNDLIFINLFE
jgi:hypothetical protein